MKISKKSRKAIDEFFDKRLEFIYEEEYEDSGEPMPFDEVKKHFIEFLEKGFEPKEAKK